MSEEKHKQNLKKEKVMPAPSTQKEHGSEAGEDLARAKKEKVFFIYLSVFVFVLVFFGGYLFHRILTFKSPSSQISLASCMGGEFFHQGEKQPIIAPQLKENDTTTENKEDDTPLIPVEQNNNQIEEKDTPAVSEEVMGFMNNMRKRTEIFFPEIRYLDLEWKINDGGTEDILTIKSMRYSIKRTQLKSDKPSMEELFIKDNFKASNLNSITMNKTKVMAYEKNNMACLYSESPSIDIVTQHEVPDRFDISLSCGLLP